MPALADQLAEVAAARAAASVAVDDAWAAYVTAVAELESLDAMESAIRGRRAIPADLSHLTAGDAVLAVARDIGGVVAPKEVWTQLRERGHEDQTEKSVGVYLGRLVASGAIERVGRGRYLAR